jgi:hypothetical protein
LRCCDSNCPFRENADKPDILVEDEEEPNFEDSFEQGEDDIGDAEGVLGSPAASQGEAGLSDRAAGVTLNLFPFAAPLAAHKKILSDILRASEPLGASLWGPVAGNT